MIPYFRSRPIMATSIRVLSRSFAKKSGKKGKKVKEMLPGQGVGLLQGIELCREHAWASFTESLECSVTLNIDPRKVNQNIKAVHYTPFSLGKKTDILVFSSEAGAKEVVEKHEFTHLSRDDIDEFADRPGKVKYSHIFCTSDVYDSVKRKLGRKLGSKKLLPNAASKTLVYNVDELDSTLARVKHGAVNLRNDRYGNIRFSFGRLTLTNQELLQNLSSVLLKIIASKPESSPKGKYILSLAISSTMGPGVKLNVRHANPTSVYFGKPVAVSEVEIEREKCIKSKAKRLEIRKKGTTRHPCKRDDGTYMTMKEYAVFKAEQKEKEVKAEA